MNYVRCRKTYKTVLHIHCH